jgi:hypothetical protein
MKNESIKKTDYSILERFSRDELWIYFVEKVCQECSLAEDECNKLKAKGCFDDWLQVCP